MMSEYSFGACQICGQGQLIAVRDIATQQLLVMCDDCESQWRSPDEARLFNKALSQEIRSVEIATLEEMVAAGWIR